MKKSEFRRRLPSEFNAVVTGSMTAPMPGASTVRLVSCQTENGNARFYITPNVNMVLEGGDAVRVSKGMLTIVGRFNVTKLSDNSKSGAFLESAIEEESFLEKMSL